jgi:TolA-binding protein
MNGAGYLSRGVRCVFAASVCWLLAVGSLAAQEKKEAATPKSSNAAIAQYRAAVAFQNRGVFDLAAAEWAAFLKQFPTDPLAGKAEHYLGVCLFQQKKYPEAQAAFEKLIAAHPKFELLNESLYNLALAQYNQGHGGQPAAFDRAAATFQTLLTKFPDSAQAPFGTYYLAEALYARDKKPEAIASYRKFLKDFPKHELREQTLYGLGVALEEATQPAEAGKVYDQLLAEFPKSTLATEVAMRRGDTLVALDDYAGAEKRFAAAAAVERYEFADYALQRQGLCAYQLKKYPEAGALYAKLPEAFPKSAYVGTATLAAGKCFYLAGDFDQARAWLAKGTALGGESTFEAAHWLAQILLKEKKPAEAMKTVEGVLPKATEAKSIWLADLQMDRADALYEIPERRKDSVALYAAFAKAYPKHASAPQAAYMAAYAALGLGDFEAALAHAQAFLAAYPEHALKPDVLYVQAECLLQQKKYAEAEAIYTALLKDYADRAEASAWRVRQALCLQLLGKHALLVEAISPHLPKLKGEALAEALYLIGFSQFELKQPAKAVESLTASRVAAPKWRQADETLLLLARAQRESGDLKAATETVTQLIAEFPESKILDRATYRLGELKAAAEDYPAAMAAFQKVIASWPESELVPFSLYELGWAQFRSGDQKTAGVSWTTLIDKYAMNAQVPAARYARAVVRQQAGDYAGAIEDLQAYLKSEPAADQKLDASFVIGQCQAGLKKFEDAIKSFEAILATDPKYADTDKVLYELAWSQQASDKIAEAGATFARLAKEFPKSTLAGDSQFRVGETHYQKAEYDKAAVAYFEAVNLAGKTDLGEKAAHMLAWCYFQQKDYPRAEESFSFQLKTYPEGPKASDARIMLGEALFKQAKYEPALAAFTAGLAGKPSGDEFVTLALLHAGQSAGQLKKWDVSLKLLQECATKFPESPYQQEVLYEEARAMHNLGQTAEAMKVYRQVALTGQGEAAAKAEFMVGELLFAEKKYAEAVRSFFKVAYGYGQADPPPAIVTAKADSTFEAARCLEMLKKLPEAKKLYKEVVDNFPKSDKAPEAQKKIAALGG